MDKKTTLDFLLSDQEISLVWLALKHLESMVSDPETISTLLNYFDTIMKGGQTPFDTHVKLTKENAMDIDNSLNELIVDAVYAKEYGGEDEEMIGKIQISKLAENTPKIRDILRRLDNCAKIAELENRISKLEQNK